MMSNTAFIYGKTFEGSSIKRGLCLLHNCCLSGPEKIPRVAALGAPSSMGYSVGHCLDHGHCWGSAGGGEGTWSAPAVGV